MNRFLALSLVVLALAGCSAPDTERAPKQSSPAAVQIVGVPSDATRAAIDDWVQDAHKAVIAYYGRIPDEQTRIIIEIQPGDEVYNGVTRIENGRPVIHMPIGVDTDERAFREDWVLTHEMIHTAFPEVHRSHHWIEEGLATYVEPIARARAGLVSVADAWEELVAGLPKGQPRRGDRGLDRTRSWGRTYWGGALFCFLADVEIRERTSNRYGLRDALTALVNDGWTMTRYVDLDVLLARMDKTVGVPVLTELYAKHAHSGVRVDLGAMWKRLGIVHERGRVTFDDTAPMAAVRRAILH
jgi:hypothetical protein